MFKWDKSSRLALTKTPSSHSVKAADCLVVDPGLEAGKIMDYLEEKKLTQTPS